MSKKGTRDPESGGSGSGLRYKNFHNDEPSSASDFSSSTGATSSQQQRGQAALRFQDREDGQDDLGVQNETFAADLRLGRDADRNYQSLSSDTFNPISTRSNYPPRNLFDDV